MIDNARPRHSVHTGYCARSPTNEFYARSFCGTGFSFIVKTHSMLHPVGMAFSQTKTHSMLHPMERARCERHRCCTTNGEHVFVFVQTCLNRCCTTRGVHVSFFEKKKCSETMRPYPRLRTRQAHRTHTKHIRLRLLDILVLQSPHLNISNNKHILGKKNAVP